MAMDRGGGRMARVLAVVLAFVLLGSAGHLAAVTPAVDAPAAAADAPAPAGTVGAGDSGGRSGDGSPDVLPPQPGIHVPVNRGSERSGAPAPAVAVAAPPAAALAGRGGHAAPGAPAAGDTPAAGARRDRAPPAAAA
jgi:hypothetical protein